MHHHIGFPAPPTLLSMGHTNIIGARVLNVDTLSQKGGVKQRKSAKPKLKKHRFCTLSSIFKNLAITF